jgi:hypothetical protein
MPNANNSLHLVEQTHRYHLAAQAVLKLNSDFRELSKNVEVLMHWQFAEANLRAILAGVVEARQAEELKRAEEIRTVFNSRDLLEGAA